MPICMNNTYNHMFVLWMYMGYHVNTQRLVKNGALNMVA